jgi:proteasome accessory factor C
MRETSAERLSRLLALVPWLEQHDGVSISEAASHFGVSPQELEQDLWLTICCGLPGHGPDQLIDIQFWDEDGSIHVIDTQSLDRPLRLTAAESTALLVGLRLLSQVDGDHDRSALASVTAKLEQASDRPEESPAVVVEADHTEFMERISAAIKTHRAIELEYAGASRDEVTHRVVDPSEVVHYRGRPYVLAWCRSADAQRTFRLDRIRSLRVLEEPVIPRRIHQEIAPAVGVAVRVRVAPGSRWLLETLDVIDVVEDDLGNVDATFVVANPSWLVRLVLGQAGGVEVLDPPGVRTAVAVAADQALGRLLSNPS